MRKVNEFCVLIAGASMLFVVTPCSAQLIDAFDKTNPQAEIEIGREGARQTERTQPLSRNPAHIGRVRRVGMALVDAMDQKAYPYEFKVLAVNDYNAFCYPGGFMYVNEGLLERIPDDNALAWVMAHEITHARHRHWAHELQRMKGPTIVGILTGAVTGNFDSAAYAMALTRVRYKRGDEADADYAGMELAWAAGFDPVKALVAVEELVKMEKGAHVPDYLRDHPPATDRLSKMTALSLKLKDQQRPTKLTDTPKPEIALATLVGRLPVEKTAENPWYPLGVGRTWTYRISGATPTAYTVQVASVITTPAGPVYRVETALTRSTVVACQMLTTDGEAWRRNRPSDTQSNWQGEMFFAGKEGEKAEKDGVTYTVQKSETLTLPCGTFTDVMKIRKQTGTSVFDLWFARGVGLVKRVNVETGLEETLIAYKAKGS